MRNGRSIGKREKEAGIALLIAIFILLLIGVVGIALVVSSGTESALAGNYRSATSVQYAAVAGLEEVRSRLRSSDPNYFGTTNPGFLPAGATLGPCNPRYVLNPLGAEAVTPWDPANPYYDREFSQEFPLDCGGNPPPSPSPKALSIWNRAPLSGLPFPSPYYKWVRINGVSEQSLNIDTGPTYDGINGNLIYYDGQNLRDTGSSGNQVYELTALAVMQNGSQKLVQYLVAPQPLNLSFPAALIVDGTGTAPVFGASTSSSFYVSGNDQGSVGSCNPGPTAYTAVGYTDTSYTAANFQPPSDTNGIPPSLKGNYSGAGGSTPNVAAVTLSPNLATVGGLNSLVQTIQQNADVVVNGNATQTSTSGPLPSTMSATNPMTIVINGDFTLNGWGNTGYGLLLVTGNFTYDPHTSWDGIILVIGKGLMSANQGSSATTLIQGAVLIANTVGLPASSPPASSRFNFQATPPTLTNGIYYSSCWIKAATPNAAYKILSFHEISQ